MTNQPVEDRLQTPNPDEQTGLTPPVSESSEQKPMAGHVDEKRVVPFGKPGVRVKKD